MFTKEDCEDDILEKLIKFFEDRGEFVSENTLECLSSEIILLIDLM